MTVILSYLYTMYLQRCLIFDKRPTHVEVLRNRYRTGICLKLKVFDGVIVNYAILGKINRLVPGIRAPLWKQASQTICVQKNLFRMRVLF
jgi:hypothetical protein